MDQEEQNNKPMSIFTIPSLRTGDNLSVSAAKRSKDNDGFQHELGAYDEDDEDHHSILPSQQDQKPGRAKPGRKMVNSEPQDKKVAQQRAASRAFRERKANYIKELEQKVADLSAQLASAGSGPLPQQPQPLPPPQNPDPILAQRVATLEAENTLLRQMTFSFDFKRQEPHQIRCSRCKSKCRCKCRLPCFHSCRPHSSSCYHSSSNSTNNNNNPYTRFSPLPSRPPSPVTTPSPFSFNPPLRRQTLPSFYPPPPHPPAQPPASTNQVLSHPRLLAPPRSHRTPPLSPQATLTFPPSSTSAATAKPLRRRPLTLLAGPCTKRAERVAATAPTCLMSSTKWSRRSRRR
ncbi:hypothetical protein BC830DRAFT_463608 [Chytriomyces sp. MP71]|nr:hypothetical protein BC830DRAFT_463608 [Chytriomyces sp. MP71]